MGIRMGISRHHSNRSNGQGGSSPVIWPGARGPDGPYLRQMLSPAVSEDLELDPYSARVAHAYELVGPAVASVVALRKDASPAGQGSGVVFTPDGYLLTNSHVAGGANDFLVTLPSGVKSPARMVGDDPETDLAVLRMSADGLAYPKFGSSSQLPIRELVVAIANPSEYQTTVTAGNRSHPA